MANFIGTVLQRAFPTASRAFQTPPSSQFAGPAAAAPPPPRPVSSELQFYLGAIQSATTDAQRLERLVSAYVELLKTEVPGAPFAQQVAIILAVRDLGWL